MKSMAPSFIAWTAIGARTSESQTHREMASGLSTPVGFKNGTDGSLDAAVNGVLSASHPHSFLGINGQGQSSVIRTRGNAYGHVVLRGGEGERIRQFGHDQLIEPLAQGGLDPGSWTRCHFGYAASVRVADLAAA